MIWEQKVEALMALGGDLSLRMRKPGDWYVSNRGVEIGDGRFLTSGGGNGRTPEAAVENYWRELTELEPDKFVVINAYQSCRREVRWNGFMWAEIALTPSARPQE